MGFVIHYHPNKDLAKLAWLARVDPDSENILIIHGPSVECKNDWLVEGVWDDDFERGNFHRSENFFGSGMRIEGDSIYFVPSERLCRENAGKENTIRCHYSNPYQAASVWSMNQPEMGSFFRIPKSMPPSTATSASNAPRQRISANTNPENSRQLLRLYGGDAHGRQRGIDLFVIGELAAVFVEAENEEDVLDDADAIQPPTVGRDALVELRLHGSLGREVFYEGLREYVMGGAIFFGHSGDLTGEAVTERVHAGAFAALFRFCAC